MQLGEEQLFEDKHIRVQRLGGEGACVPRREHVLEYLQVSFVPSHLGRAILILSGGIDPRPRARLNPGR